MTRDPETTYRIMSAIKSKDTKPELILGKAMWALGLRYRKHGKDIPGKPDFVFRGKKIAIFCDGDFWHGNNWKLRGLKSLREELENYDDFWRNKITRNIERDKEVNRRLEDDGWLVLRFWESDIKSNPNRCANTVFQSYKSRT